jgi:hypothetical protein
MAKIANGTITADAAIEIANKLNRLLVQTPELESMKTIANPTIAKAIVAREVVINSTTIPEKTTRAASRLR